VLAVSSGMRQGELLALRWEDVDLEAGTLRVQRSVSHTKDGPVFTPPKSAKSRRRIKLTRSAVEALRRHRADQNSHRLRLGTLWEDHRGLVFPNRTGGAMRPWSLTGGPYLRLLKKAEISQKVRFHDLRHTRALLCCYSRTRIPDWSRSYSDTPASPSPWILIVTSCPAWTTASRT
jgi:integrase